MSPVASDANHFDPRPLGTSSVLIPALGLGTAPLGGWPEPIADEQSAAVLARAYDLGIRHFDTAPLYGYGLAETRLGSFLAGIDDAVIIGTKVGRVLQADREPDVFDFSRDGVRESLAASLRRLGQRRVDIAYIHDPDAHFKAAAREALAALLDLQKEGQVGAIGVGMNQWEMLAAFAELHRFDCFLLAGRYTLLDQSALKELLPICLRRGISIIAGGVFNSGVLADPDHNAHYNYAQAPVEIVERARAIRALAERHNIPAPALAIQFPLAHPAITAVLVGARTSAEVEENVAAFHHAVPLKVWAELKATGLLPEEAPTPTEGP